MKPVKYLQHICFLLLIIIFSAFSSAAKISIDETVFQQIIGSAAVAVSLKGNQMPASPPDALIKDLYRTHAKNSGVIVQGKNRAILDKYFDKKLADLIWKDVTTHQEEVGVIDFDLFYNAQDISISKLIVKPAQIDGSRARVIVAFNNFKRRNTLTYLLVRENFVWKISDIDYGHGETLRHYFDKTF